MRLPQDNAAGLALSLGRRIRALREAAGITQEKLAYESGLRSKGTLSKIEAGRLLPTLSVLDLLARRLGVDLLDLFVLPAQGNPRHDLIDATRGLPGAALATVLRSIDGTLVPILPFEEVQRPKVEDDPPTAIPLLGLDVAAGSFDGVYVDRGTRWVKPASARRLHRGCFVARVVGSSMEPTLPNGAWAIFTRRVSDNPKGKVVIAQYGGLVDADTAASYTVKRFRAIASRAGAAGRWREVQLVPDNPSFETIVVRRERLGDLTIVAELVELLGGTRSSIDNSEPSLSK